jgi:uncharacterized protein affecting Mg2+/Co2+ transport
MVGIIGNQPSLELDGDYSLHSVKMISSTEYWISGGKRMEKEESAEAAATAAAGEVIAVAVRVEDEEESGRKLRRKLFKD